MENLRESLRGIFDGRNECQIQAPHKICENTGFH